ncbi:hypothetical protein LXM94_13285 [Rhizobium sp. TRM95111]|uniref:hypothetical protein n=1 Tax=Rhizobium alarense TaxID=2846851 RepID=UPI001F2932CB|nr:hypothetical protein [Rhizobium alarense]MCF3640945.1 hypothetical protein [Rhizobium alarense]
MRDFTSGSDVKNDNLTSSPELLRPEPPVSDPRSNLLDMAKERAARRAERQKRKLMRQATQNEGGRRSELDEDDDAQILGRRKPTGNTTAKSMLELPKMQKKRNRHPIALLFFALAVVLPSLATAFYFALIATPQYEVEAQFAVRGATQNTATALGLTALVGTSVQTGDSYIVADYIQSLQILEDLRDKAGVDVREMYARNNIDFFYRQTTDRPFDEFVSYWRDMVQVSFNSTTGNVTLQVYAFSPTDAKLIADGILKVSERLVNTLSEDSRSQIIGVANQQVARAEVRLQKVRTELDDLRQREQAIDPQALATLESQIIGSLERDIASMKTRYKALLDTVNADAPSARVLERQIAAAEAQLTEQKTRVGTGTTPKTDRRGAAEARNISELMNQFSALTLEQEFATKAYMATLASLETAVQDAQKLDRYFAIYVRPSSPEVALYPKRLQTTLMLVAAFLAIWLIGYFCFRSIKDHAI